MKARGHAKRISDLATVLTESKQLEPFAVQASQDSEVNETAAVLFSAAAVCFKADAKDEGIACVNAVLKVVEHRAEKAE